MRLQLIPAVLAATFLFGCDTQKDTSEQTPQTLVSTTASSPEEDTALTYQSEIWVTGAQFMGANGMYFGPAGKLHLASVVTSALFIVDHENGKILGMYGVDKGVANPDDLAFNQDGLLCWTGIVPGTVGCITPEGEHYPVAQLGPGAGPNPITFTDDGRLFVGECFFGFELYELDPTGKQVKNPRLVTTERKLGPSGPQQKCGFNGMDIGPDGKLYGPRWFDGEVARMDPDSGAFETFVDGFAAPAAVKFDAQQRLHVLDSGTGELFRIEQDKSKTLLAQLTPGLDNLAFNSEGRLFVSSYADGFIAEILPERKVRWVTPPGLSMAGSAMITHRDSKPQLLISDYYSLKYYDLDSGKMSHATRGIVDFPEGLGTVLSVSEAGDKLLITSWIDQQVKLWDDATGTLELDLRAIGEPIDAVMFNGDIVYSEAGSSTVYSIAPIATDKPAPIARYKSASTPAGLALTEDNSLYLTEFADSGQLVQLAEKGQWLSQARVIATGLNKAEGLQVVGNRAYVVETGAQQVSVVAIDSGEKTTIASDLKIGIPAPPHFPPTMLFTGVAVDEQGMVYVPADVGHTIYRITPTP